MAGIITYKTVITQAIEGFNLIQNTLATNFPELNVNQVIKNGSTVTGSLTPAEISSKITELAVILDKFGGDIIRSGRVELFEGGSIIGSTGGSGDAGGSSLPIVSALPTANASSYGQAVIYNNEVYVCLEKED